MGSVLQIGHFDFGLGGTSIPHLQHTPHASPGDAEPDRFRRGSQVVRQEPHKLCTAGSIPAPATNYPPAPVLAELQSLGVPATEAHASTRNEMPAGCSLPGTRGAGGSNSRNQSGERVPAPRSPAEFDGENTGPLEASKSDRLAAGVEARPAVYLLSAWCRVHESPALRRLIGADADSAALANFLGS